MRLGHVAYQIRTVGDPDHRPFVALEHLNGGTGQLSVGADLQDRDPDPAGMVAFESGDVLFGKLRPYLRKSWRATFPGFCSSELIVMRACDGVDDRWLGYVAQSDLLVGWAVATSEGVKMPRTAWEKLRLLDLNVPRLELQRAMADYLDAETASIDATISALRQSLGLMGERRKSLIVSGFRQEPGATRGTTVRALADPLLGRQRSPDQAHGPHMMRYLRAANVKDGRLDLDDIKEMNFDPGEQVTFSLRPGDVLITEGAGSLAAVGANAVWHGELQGTICFQNTLIRLRPRPDSDPRFVAWWARYAFESGLLAAAADGANIYHLGVETVRGLPAWAPSIVVQREVAVELDREVSGLERQARIRQRQIDLLLERRLALITAAVTRQLEIPGVAA